MPFPDNLQKKKLKLKLTVNPCSKIKILTRIQKDEIQVTALLSVLKSEIDFSGLVNNQILRSDESTDVTISNKKLRWASNSHWISEKVNDQRKHGATRKNHL